MLNPRNHWVPITFVLVAISGCAGPDLKKTEMARERFVQQHPDRILTASLPWTKIRYVRAGDSASRQRPPLLFIHGSPGEWGGWADFFSDEYLLANFDVLALDRPGYGGSGAGTPELSLARQAEAVLAVLKTNESGAAAILVGHSYGGPVAVRAAIDFPNRVAGIVVVAGALSPALEETKWYQHVARWAPFRWLVPESLDVCNREIMALKGELESMDGEWSKIKAPVYLLHGDKDPLVPVGNVAFAQARLGQSVRHEEKIVAGMNHFVPWEHPDRILEAVRWAKGLSENR